MTEKQPDGSGFVHLHVHAENSQLDGFARVKTIPSTAAALGQKALALTDHESLAGAWKFQKNCLAAGIKPIIGCEMYMSIGSRFERNFETVINDDDNATDADEGKEKIKRYMHLTVLARNEDGWKSLLALHNKAQDSYWYKPRIDFDLIHEHGEGLIILTGCLGGPVAGPLARAGAIDKAFEAACSKISAALGDRTPADLESHLTAETVAYAALKDRVATSDGVERARLLAELRSFVPKESEAASEDAAAIIRSFAASLPGTPRDATGFRNDARANLDRLIAAVGREHVFLEVMHHGIKAETHAFREIRALSAETGIPMVATNDCHYEHAEDAEGHDGFLAVGVKRSKDDPNRFRFNGTPDYYVKSEAQMLDVLGNISNKEAAKAWRDAVAMSVHVADLCADKVIPDPRMRLPRFPVPEGFDSERAYFHHLVKEGAIERFGTDPETGAKRPVPLEVRQRLRVEEDIICDMGFPAYFLIVWDVIAWARSDYSAQDWVDKHAGKPVNEKTRTRKKPIMVGVGRGSAAGSMASYCLKIVGVDPIENHLLFERFLEPGRAGMPDIDVDFEAARRAEVFSYLGVRWGKDRVAHIGTFGMALSKAAIKDAARILKPHGPSEEVAEEAADLRAKGEFAKAGALMKRASIDAESRGAALQRLGNKMSDLVPSNGGKAFTFAQLDNTSDAQGEAFRDLISESGQDAQDILKLARAFEGITKTESIHACGFIISPEPLDDIVPMRWQSHAANADPNAPRVICWDGPDCEELGLLKMDVLGLTNLDIASTALDYIKDTTGTVFTLEEIPHPSTKGNPIVDGAYGLMAAGRTSGLFQMESAGMIKIAQSVVPENLDDVSAIVALFRPGPLKAGMDRSYAARKSGEEQVTYTDFTNDPVETAAIDKILGATYGMAIYQETIMRLSTTVAGFDASQRSRLRKAMGKKKQSEMDACLTMWLEGAPKEFRDEDGNVISPVFSPVSAQKLWDFISGAASYLFNASHSAAYGQLAYYTAYLKSGWPVEYAAAILAVADKEEKRLTALSALRADGIEVLSPDVNKSRESTAPVDGKILFGLSEIKDVGVNGVHIVAEREANGPFTSMADLIERVKVPSEKSPTGYGKVPTGALQGLIEAGAMDSFGPRLGLLMSMRAANGNPNVPVPDAVWNILEEATRQRQRLGVSLGIHPLTALREQLAAWRTPGEGEYGDSTGARPSPLHKIPDRNGSPVLTLGVLSQWDEKAYGGGRRANFAIESSKTSIQGVLWNRTLAGLRSNGNVPKIGDIVAVSGKVNVRSTVIGDDDSETQETISTKELNIFELWPVKTQNTSLVPRETQAGSNVLSFADLYRKVRATALLESPTPPKGGGEPAPSPSAAEPAPNVVSLDAARAERNRQEPIFAAVSAHGTARVGTSIISGPRETAAAHSWTLLPVKKLTDGDVFRADLANGNRLYALVEDSRFTEEQVVDMVKDCQDDDSRWAPVSWAPQKDIAQWYRLTSSVPAAAEDPQRVAV